MNRLSSGVSLVTIACIAAYCQSASGPSVPKKSAGAQPQNAQPQKKTAAPTKKESLPKPAASTKKPSCDELTAHPDDKDKTGAGVLDESIDAELGIEQCAAAVEQNPQTARLHFQLGRAYWAAERYDEALESFLRAEEMDYAPAYFYIGMAYEDGLIEGEEPDLAMARDMYMIAASEGFAPAILAYQDFEEAWEVDFKKGFTKPEFAQAIYENKFQVWESLQGSGQDNLEKREAFLVYLRGVHDYLEVDPNPEDPECPKLYSKGVSNALNGLVRVNNGLPAEQGTLMQEMQNVNRLSAGKSLMQIMQEASRRAPNIQASRQAGTDDIYAITDYGGCGGAPARQFYGNMARWITKGDYNPPGGSSTSAAVPPANVPPTFKTSCLTYHVKTVRGSSENRWMEYCTCLDRQYASVLTDAERKRVISNFGTLDEIFSSTPEQRSAPGFAWRLYTPRNACLR